MSETVLVARTGRTTGSASARRMRAEDVIPAVVYGQGMDPISVSVTRRDLRVALSGPAGVNTVLDLDVDGTVYPAIVKEMQRHPVRRTVQHVDFIQVNLNEQIRVSVPVRLEGEAKEVLQENGLVDLALPEIEVSTTPRLIPDEVVIDVSDMTMSSTITIADRNTHRQWVSSAIQAARAGPKRAGSTQAAAKAPMSYPRRSQWALSRAAASRLAG